jgi:REP-associated tyrosine transposase
MSIRSYTKAWFHLIWGTHNREKLIINKDLRKDLSKYYYEYSEIKKIFMKINFVNSDHVHALIDLPTNITIEDTLHLLKGASSNWLNKRVNYKFSWGKGYAAFSVSESKLPQVITYIRGQEEHHKYKGFAIEYDEFIKKHNIILNG